MGRYDKRLFAPPKKRRVGCLVFPLLMAFILSALLFLNGALNQNPTRLEERIVLPELSSSLQNIRILHLSDLHGNLFGPHQEKLVELFKHDNIKMVCMTGDMVGKKGNVQPLLELLDAIPEDIPVYLIAGDDDPPVMSEEPNAEDSPKSDWVRQAEKHGAIYLDSPRMLEIGKARIWVCPGELLTLDFAAARQALEERKKEILASGTRDSAQNTAGLLNVNYRLSVLDQTELAKREMLSKDLYISLSHHPVSNADVAVIQSSLSETNQTLVMTNFPGSLSLVLSGHFNNGQVRLPFVGPLYSPPIFDSLQSASPSQSRALSGLFSLRGVYQYISPGMGVSSKYPLWLSYRLYNPPAITILTLSDTYKK